MENGGTVERDALTLLIMFTTAAVENTHYWLNLGVRKCMTEGMYSYVCIRSVHPHENMVAGLKLCT